MPRLVVLSEGFAGTTYDLKAERTTVGRVEDNSFCIPDGSVSSHHCEILLKGDEVIVRDLDSTNGTYINDEQITEAALKPGQTLRLGQVDCKLEVEGARAEAAPAAPQQKPPQRKAPAQTTALPQGIKRDELDQGPRPVMDRSGSFKKKNNKVGLFFITAGIILGIIIAIFIVYAAIQATRGSG